MVTIIDLDDATKADIKLLKAALQEKAGKKQDPLVVSRNFYAREILMQEIKVVTKEYQIMHLS